MTGPKGSPEAKNCARLPGKDDGEVGILRPKLENILDETSH